MRHTQNLLNYGISECHLECHATSNEVMHRNKKKNRIKESRKYERTDISKKK